MKYEICTQCKKPLPTPKDTGRPARYCSKACRRSAEMEIRRINSRIEILEKQRDQLTANKRRFNNLFNGYVNEKQEADDLDEAIRLARVRLLEVIREQESE